MTTIGSPALWGGFIVFVLLMLALDLGVFHRKAHAVSFKEAAIWSCVWISLALIFNVGIWKWFGDEAGMAFLTGYLVEKSLSVDNIFVFVVVFGAFSIPAAYQHRVLFWGILTALVLRAGMIFAGVAMLERFHWLIYVFGAFLVFTGVKLFLSWKKGQEDDVSEGFAMRMIRKMVPSTPRFDGPRFFTIENGRRLATPMFIALLIVEFTDVVFALDSIPAIFAITRDPFIVFTSNIFAILGLRSLFFLLAGMVERFTYLKVGLSGVLVFVGVKMTIVDVVKIAPSVSLAVIGGILALSIGASLWKTRGQSAEVPEVR
ncbi:MAG: TerC family protein [Myxococcaceae bacterium]